MKIQSIHAWDIPVKTAIRLQEALAIQLISYGRISSFHKVAGCDVAYDQQRGLVFGGVVLWDLDQWKIQETLVAQRPLTFPYIPGLLGFREAPVLLDAFARLKGMPDVILVDGQGIAHPRGLGLASHLGLHVTSPTVGCAKSRLIGNHDLTGPGRGDYVWLVHEGRRVGAVVRSRTGVRPIYVSPGNRISPEGALEVVLACLGPFRIPEPLRHAHLLAERQKRATR